MALARRVGDSSALAGVLHNLASVEMQSGRLDVAHNHQREALELFRREFGDRHEYVMRAWISLSTLEGLRAAWPAAERSLRHALAIAETPEALANYAVVLDRLGRGGEAKKIRQRVAPTASNPLIDASALRHEQSRLPVVAR
jgi:hypothetical protein